jgi:lipoyl-dependent peroxiredoxin
MPVRKGNAVWKGSLKEGRGTIELQSGAFSGQYSFSTRFEEGKGTNPEELIGGAHAGCYSMALSGELGKAGYDPESIETEARVQLDKSDKGFTITKITLSTKGKVPGISNDEFQKIAKGAKEGCPVSRLLTGAQIELEAELLQ